MASEILRDVPSPVPQAQEHWGSDAIAAMLRALDIPYLALNPGASYRGLHDSIVNYLGNEKPQMLLCLHEEAAVAIAHGYARTSGKMMGAVLHSNVGLMHGTMAIFNAWCDRVPMLILGATGPWDAARRRPWIDWIHTASDQGALVRDYTKWDNQPASVPAAYEALLRAVQMANTAPRGPTYINLDAALQETKIGPLPPLPEVSRFQPAAPVRPDEASIAKAAQLLSAAKNPAMLIGRVSRSEAAWKARVALAEKVQAKVFTDMKAACAFPTDHPLHAAPPATFPDGKLLRECDVIVSGGVGRRAGERENHPRLHGRARASRLERRLPGPAAGRRLPDVRAGRRGAAAARGGAYPAGSGADEIGSESREGRGVIAACIGASVQ